MDLLKRLYEVYAPSNGEKKIKRFIKRWVRDNVKDAVIRADNHDGNVYISKGYSDTYPCVVAHLDQVQRNHSDDFKAVETEDIIFGYSPSKRCREGLGADDKNGIWVALKCLEQFDTIKVAFFVGEEVGCIGSGRSDLWWFKDCKYIIEADRRGSSDLIVDISGRICSKEFEEAINADWFGYAPTYGLLTDVMELSDRGVGLSCINVSCGYYEPHSDDEFTVKADLENCLSFVKHIIANVDEVYPHTYESSYAGYYSGSYGSKYVHNSYSGYKGASYYSRLQESVDEKPYAPMIIYINDYADLDSYVDQLIYQNCWYYTPEELWPYIESDLATYEIDKETFLEMAEVYYEQYIEEYYNSDDYYASYWDKQ